MTRQRSARHRIWSILDVNFDVTVYRPSNGFVTCCDRFKFDNSATPSAEETVKGMIVRLEEGRKAA